MLKSNESVLLGNYFNEANVLIKNTANELKKEYFFELDDFNQTKNVEGLETVANLIKNLLFLEKNTYPDSPNMGIGIQNFQFELLNDSTIEKIRQEIMEQVDTYLDSVFIKTLLVKKITNNTIRNTLGLGFEVTIGGNNPISEGQFFLILQGKPDTREVLSQILF